MSKLEKGLKKALLECLDAEYKNCQDPVFAKLYSEYMKKAQKRAEKLIKSKMKNK